MPVPALPFLPASWSHPPTAPALFDDNSRDWLGYGDLRARVENSLSFLPSEKRGLVFCALPRTIEGVIAYLTAAASGHAVALIDPVSPHLPLLIDAYRPEWIFAPAAQAFPGYHDTAAPFPTLRLWRSANPDPTPLHPDLYLLFLTSGSTGNPKTVRLSYKNIASNTQAIIASLALPPATIAALHLPLFYSFGLSLLHMQLATGGGCLLSERSLMDRSFWQRLRDEKASLFPGVPYHYEMLEKLGLDRLDTPALKIFLQAGGKMPLPSTRNLLRQIQNRDGALFILYGQTEAAPRMSCLPLHKNPDKIVTVGQALQGGQFEISSGEIIYRGPNVMMGYAESRANLALGDTQQGRLATGDNGDLDAEGFLTITGRRQRFAKLFGQRIALDDLENIAAPVATACAFETDDKIIVVTDDTEADICQRIRDALTAAIPLSPTWFEVRQIAALPRRANGKIDYPALRDLL